MTYLRVCVLQSCLQETCSFDFLYIKIELEHRLDDFLMCFSWKTFGVYVEGGGGGREW